MRHRFPIAVAEPLPRRTVLSTGVIHAWPIDDVGAVSLEYENRLLDVVGMPVAQRFVITPVTTDEAGLHIVEPLAPTDQSGLSAVEFGVGLLLSERLGDGSDIGRMESLAFAAGTDPEAVARAIESLVPPQTTLLLVQETRTGSAVLVDRGLFGSVRVDAGAGNDRVDLRDTLIDTLVLGGRGNDTLTGARFGDTLSGGPGHDTLVAAAHGSVLLGGRGHDRLQAVGGATRLSGGAGRDTAVVTPFDRPEQVEQYERDPAYAGHHGPWRIDEKLI